MQYGLKPLGREKLWLWLMPVPPLIGLAFGTLGSLFATLGLSFFDWDLISNPTWAGASNFIALFQNEEYIESFVNTLQFAALYVPGVVVSSLLVAVLRLNATCQPSAGAPVATWVRTYTTHPVGQLTCSILLLFAALRDDCLANLAVPSGTALCDKMLGSKSHKGFILWQKSILL